MGICLQAHESGQVAGCVFSGVLVNAREPVNYRPIAGRVRRSAGDEHVDRFELSGLALGVIAMQQNRLRRQIEMVCQVAIQ